MLTVVWEHGKGSEENRSNYMTALILHLCLDSTFYGLEKSAAIADKLFLFEIQYSEFSISPLYLIGKIQCYDRSLNHYFLLYW